MVSGTLLNAGMGKVVLTKSKTHWVGTWSKWMRTLDLSYFQVPLCNDNVDPS